MLNLHLPQTNLDVARGRMKEAEATAAKRRLSKLARRSAGR